MNNIHKIIITRLAPRGNFYNTTTNKPGINITRWSGATVEQIPEDKCYAVLDDTFLKPSSVDKKITNYINK